jgi:hypothetical protein
MTSKRKPQKVATTAALVKYVNESPEYSFEAVHKGFGEAVAKARPRPAPLRRGMRISELIAALQALKLQHGEKVPVVFDDKRAGCPLATMCMAKRSPSVGRHSTRGRKCSAFSRRSLLSRADTKPLERNYGSLGATTTP